MDSLMNMTMVLSSIMPAQADKMINVSSPKLEMYHIKQAKQTSGSRTICEYTQVPNTINMVTPVQIPTLYLPLARNEFGPNDRIAHSRPKTACMKGTIKSAESLVKIHLRSCDHIPGHINCATVPHPSILKVFRPIPCNAAKTIP